jgi:hypothetical protein
MKSEISLGKEKTCKHDRSIEVVWEQEQNKKSEHVDRLIMFFCS